MNTSCVELHASSAFSFLRGASNPEDIISAAANGGVGGVALLDRDGIYGAPRLYAAAREKGVRALVGAEVTMEDGSVLPLLCQDRRGYQNLCRLITRAKLTPRSPSLTPSIESHEKSPADRKRPCFATWGELGAHAEGLIALTGDEEGPVRVAWTKRGPQAAIDTLTRLKNFFGSSHLYAEVQRQRIRGEERYNGFLENGAAALGLQTVATGGVRYATRSARMVADVFTCLRHHTTLSTAGQRLTLNDERFVKDASARRELFRDKPALVENASRVAESVWFGLENLGYEFPEYPVPPGHCGASFLAEVTATCARDRFPSITEKLRAQLDRELAIISKLGFAGYFLIVWDICRWARERGILVQGRGSAANSAVCYALGITAVDPLKHQLLFDRFLSEGRVGADGRPSWPDIDLDLPSGALRESVIQEVFRRYAPYGAAMTANVITYRGRSTMRELGKVLEVSDSTLDGFSALYANGDFPETLDLREQLRMAGVPPGDRRGEMLVRLCGMVHGLPRHLGQHSGGIVMCRGQLDSIVPVENAAMEGRTVVQWDKDDCEDLGIIKVDFLGLGMMAAMQDALAICTERGRGPAHLHEIDFTDEETYRTMQRADTVGVFQIESRAQMASLPRMCPKKFYDVAMQVAIVRPGPIVGNLSHPLILCRAGLKEPDYIDPSVAHIVRPILERTYGVILFQEQMLALGMELANFTGAEAEELRRAMGFSRDNSRLTKALDKLAGALRKAGRNETVVNKLMESAMSFAAYGFPESHAISFALLAYASTWLKVHRPAEFLVGVLNNQPMGFYSPATLIQDARRAGRVKAKPVCVCESEWQCTVIDNQTIRIGLCYVAGLREAAVAVMIEARAARPFSSLTDFLARTPFNRGERRALASVGALARLASHRRAAMWQIEAAWSKEETLFNGLDLFDYADAESPLAPMTLPERLRADFAGLSMTAGTHPMALLRSRLVDVYAANELPLAHDGDRVTIAGSVICRQRPGTAKGFVFISLEDETGIANAVVPPATFERLRLVITQEPALRITGKLQNIAGVIHIRAEKIEPLREEDLPEQASHDFR